MATKKVGPLGRYGVRYGRGLKAKVLGIEKLQRGRHQCPYCTKKAVRRVASGIWHCKKCDTKFAGKAYVPGVKI